MPMPLRSQRSNWPYPRIASHDVVYAHTCAPELGRLPYPEAVSWPSFVATLPLLPCLSGTRKAHSSKGGYAMPHPSPQPLTRHEQAAMLAATQNHPREHLILSLALGTGLRLGELVGLDVGDVYFPNGEPRLRVLVRPEIAKRGRVGNVFLPDARIPKLERFRRFKVEHGESVDPMAPLFCALSRRRISRRRVQVLFRQWQERAGLDRLYPFHSLRHSAVTNVYRASRNLFLAQRFARHASPLTTVLYTHPGDDELREGVRGLAC